MKISNKKRKLGIAIAVSALLLVSACSPSHHSTSNGTTGGSYTVSGTVSAPTNTFSDSDINDVYATDYMVSNDTSGMAQAIADPAVVGGFVNSPGAGNYCDSNGCHGGNSVANGDTADYYSVSLKSGETVNLYIADASQYLDLYLYDGADGTTPSVTPDTGTTQTKSLTVPATGKYYIAVKVHSGGSYASNYTLTVGQPSITSASASYPSDDFAPGQVLVRFKDSTLPVGIQTAGSVANMVGMQYLSGAPGRVMLLGLGNSSQRQMAAKVLGFQTATSSQVVDATARLKLDTKRAVQALRRRTDVLSADLNYRRHVTAIPSDPDYGSQWDLPMIGMPQAWEDTTRGAGAVVAVIDTGILPGHPDLAGQLSSDGDGNGHYGYDFISDPTEAGDGDGIDPDPTDVGDKVPPELRSSFHGTHVAGTIAAITCFSGDCPSNTAIGVAGIAPHAKIMPLRALGKRGGYDADIIQAMYYAADLPNDSSTTPSQRGGRRADIINMSLGGGGYSQTFQDAVTQVRNAGVIIIAAAGNSSSSAPSYPAAYAGVVAVSAVGPSKTLAYYSNYGSDIAVAAPGGDQSVNYSNGILSTLGDDSTQSNPPVYTYGFYQGTSMAAPHVAAVAALMVPIYKANHLDANNNPIAMTPDDFDNYLHQGLLTDDIGTAGYDDKYGYGLIDASKAIVAAGTTLNIPPTMVPDKTAVDLGGVTQSIAVSVENPAQGSYAGQTVDGVTATVDSASTAWLSTSTPATTISPGSTNAISFNINVNRTNLSDGYYSGTVTLSSTTSGVANAVINVAMYKGSIAGDAGFEYITLVDADTMQQLPQQIAVNPVAGNYSFSFIGVPNGNYFIVSGTDMNNNYVICDAGEACGAYPQVGSFTVNGANVSGINFTTGFYVPSGTAALSSTNLAPLSIIQKTYSGQAVTPP